MRTTLPWLVAATSIFATLIVSSASAAPASGPRGERCAAENQTCDFVGEGTVYYGARDRWVSRRASNGVACNNATFGDPIRGVVKECYVEGGSRVLSSPPGNAVTCARENGRCEVRGRADVYYGSRDRWVVRKVRGGVDCNNATFGDPIRGVVKECRRVGGDAAPAADAAQVFEHANYQGRSQALRPGRYDIGQLSVGNDVISSVRVPRGYVVVLFEHANYQGRQIELTSDTTFLSNFNDIASSIIVRPVAASPPPPARGEVQVFEHARYEGRSQTLRPGRYDIGQLSVGNDVISSVKVPRGYVVVLFEHARFQGRQVELTSDTTFLSNFNDIASSIIVRRR